ncbi:MAG: terminase family protein [Pseudomonadota bacterium]
MANALADWIKEVEGDLDPELQLKRFLQTEMPSATPDWWQTEMYTSDEKTTACLVCRQAGKSSTLAAIAVREMQRGRFVIAVCPAERQSRELATRVKRYMTATDLVTVRSTQTEIECLNEGRWVSLPASSDTIRSYSNVGTLILDEAAFFQGGGEDIVSAVLPMLREDGSVIFSSTPSGPNNLFAQMFINPQPGVHRIKVPGTSIPRLKNKVDQMRGMLTDARYRQEYLCQFITDGQSYFSLDRIQTSNEGVIAPWN